MKTNSLPDIDTKEKGFPVTILKSSQNQFAEHVYPHSTSISQSHSTPISQSGLN